MIKQIRYTKTFKRQFKERIAMHAVLQDEFEVAIDSLLNNKHGKELRRHMLRAEYYGYESINMNDDYRIVLKEYSKSIVLAYIGTHKQLYKTRRL